MRLDLFDYHLPPELIAQKPVERREKSLLLAVDCERKRMEHRCFTDLPEYLQEGDCLVFNSSRVRRARLRGRKKEGGAEIELLLLRHLDGGVWEALAKPARRLREGNRILFDGFLEAEVTRKREEGMVELRLDKEDPGSVDEILERIGKVPLPPYIKEELLDPERYQTVFAREVGSAAAPTAGLHFTERMLSDLRDRGVRLAFLRLDVGLDTFRPLQGEEVEEHRLHSEEVFLDGECCEKVNSARREGRRIVAVGTTVVRALESSVSGGEVVPWNGRTSLFIRPGYRFKVVDCVLTNFHLPRSSLLIMVCAFAGREVVMEAYAEAVKRRYRFLSLGDACYFYYPRGRRRP
jgi:S-adenosylmethionine:tRNA ribosyltransferase-isomerase